MKSISLLIPILLLQSIAFTADRPNIIYILADDLGYGDLSCYGQSKFETPNIDRLADEGLKFTDHYSGNTVCSPSRAVLMTGQHSGHVYLRGNLRGEVGAKLNSEMVVLPEVLKAAGYSTGVFGKWGLGHTNAKDAGNPLQHGFDEFYGWKSQTIAHTYYPKTAVHNGVEVPLEKGTYLHDEVMNHARDFIQRGAEKQQPFFCYIPTAVPHAAMHAPAELHEKWRARLPQFDNKVGRYSAGDEPCPDVVNPIAGFAAMMENLDNEVGRLLQLLEDLNLDDQTIVMFSSDNGAHKEGGHNPSFWNSTGGLRGHKRDMHEGGIRAPFLVRWPGVVRRGSTSDHVSCFQDLLPTLAEIAEQPLPSQCDGISFLPLLKGESQPGHVFLYWEFCKGTEQKMFSRAVRWGRWKAFQQGQKAIELYDLKADPFEKNNIAEMHPDCVSTVKQMMQTAHQPLD